MISLFLNIIEYILVETTNNLIDINVFRQFYLYSDYHLIYKIKDKYLYYLSLTMFCLLSI